MQPLNVCLSYAGALKIVDNLSKEHDIEVQMSGDLLRELIEEPKQVRVIVIMCVCAFRGGHMCMYIQVTDVIECLHM